MHRRLHQDRKGVRRNQVVEIPGQAGNDVNQAGNDVNQAGNDIKKRVPEIAEDSLLFPDFINASPNWIQPAVSLDEIGNIPFLLGGVDGSGQCLAVYGEADFQGYDDFSYPQNVIHRVWAS